MRTLKLHFPADALPTLVVTSFFTLFVGACTADRLIVS